MLGEKIIYVKKKSQALNYPFIKKDGGIYFLAKAGKYAGLYLGFEDGDIFKAYFGEYAAIKKVVVTVLPSNMARTLEGYIIKGTVMHDFNPSGISGANEEVNP